MGGNIIAPLLPEEDVDDNHHGDRLKTRNTFLSTVLNTEYIYQYFGVKYWVISIDNLVFLSAYGLPGIEYRMF